MIVEYSNIADSAKVLIYPSSRKFYTTETKELKEKIQQFLENWSLHNTPNISHKFLYDRFIIFFIDDSEAPLKNKSVDTIVSFILSLETSYKIVLLDKMNVCFKQGKYVQYKELKDFKGLLKNNALSEKSIVFDNLVSSKLDFENYWETTIADSWYSRFIK